MTKKLAYWWKRLWCALDGHGGVTTIDGSHEFRPGSYCLCKRCGAITRLI
jgi:hypothetical protein